MFDWPHVSVWKESVPAGAAAALQGWEAGITARIAVESEGRRGTSTSALLLAFPWRLRQPVIRKTPENFGIRPLAFA